MKITDYLARIQATRSSTPNLSFLRSLQCHHLQTVPFENLSIVYGEPIVLDLPTLYHKIVERSRGGFCYELNSLFGWLLTELGYDVTYIAASVYNAEREAYSSPFAHLSLLVQLDRPYLVDVGFGNSARGPVPLPGWVNPNQPHSNRAENPVYKRVYEDVSGRYRIVTTADNNDVQDSEPYTHILQHIDPTIIPLKWRPKYRFNTTPRILSDYEAMCIYQQTSPDSIFTQRTICTRAMPDGRLTLTHDAYIVTQNHEQTKTPIESETERRRLLQAHFGIVL